MGDFYAPPMPQQIQVDPTGAFLKGRAMALAYQNDKLQNQMLQQQVADYPKQQDYARQKGLMEQQRLNQSQQFTEDQSRGQALLSLAQKISGSTDPEEQRAGLQTLYQQSGSPVDLSQASPTALKKAAQITELTLQSKYGKAEPIKTPEHWGAIYQRNGIDVQENQDTGRVQAVNDRPSINVAAPYNPATMDPMAKKVAAGDAPMPTGRTLQQLGGAEFTKQVIATNPQWDAYTYPTKQAQIKNYTSGVAGRQVMAMDTVVKHAATAQSAFDALANGDIPAFNKAMNIVASGLGKPAPSGFEPARIMIGDEVIKSIIATGGGEEERKDAQKLLDMGQSPAMLSASLRTILQLMAGRMEVMRQNYEGVLGEGSFQKRLTPESYSVLQQYEGNKSPDSGAGISAQRRAELEKKYGAQ